MDAVSSSEMTITASSRAFSVPRKTLDDRVKGHVTHDKKPVIKNVLSAEEESSLVQYLLYMAQRGFPLTRTMTKAFAWAISKRSGTDNRFSKSDGPGEHWWQLFRSRHPEIRLRKSDNLERSQAEALNPTIVEEYFNILEATLTKHEHDLLTSPRQLYNCDETFLPINYIKEKVVAAKGAKNVYSQNVGTSDHINLLLHQQRVSLSLP